MRELCHCERSEAIHLAWPVFDKDGLPRRLTPARNNGLIRNGGCFDAPPTVIPAQAGISADGASTKKIPAGAGMTGLGSLATAPGISALGGQTHA